MLAELPYFLRGSPEWRFTHPLSLVNALPNTAEVLEVAETAACLKLSHLELTSGFLPRSPALPLSLSCFMVHRFVPWPGVTGNRVGTCDDDEFVVTHGGSPQVVEGDLAGLARGHLGSFLYCHPLLLHMTESHITGLCPACGTYSQSCSTTVDFVQPQSV